MRLLKLNEKVQQMVIDDMISTGHARALLGIDDLENQYTIAHQLLDSNFEEIWHVLEEKMKVILGTKVAINQKDNKKGKIEIEYYSMDELDRIMDLFRTIEK